MNDSANQPDESGENIDISLDVKISPRNEGETRLIQPILGLRPYVLIELDASEGDEDFLLVRVNAGGGPESHHDIAELLEMIAAGMREGTVTSYTVDGEEVDPT